MAANRRHYDEEFKRRAVQLSYKRDRTLTSVAKALGVRSNLIYRWRKKYTPDGDTTKLSEQNDEIQALHVRIAELEEENDILKKASLGFNRSTQHRVE